MKIPSTPIPPKKTTLVSAWEAIRLAKSFWDFFKIGSQHRNRGVDRDGAEGGIVSEGVAQVIEDLGNPLLALGDSRLAYLS